MLGITHARCLVLDKRYEEFARIKKEWQLLGIDVIPFFCGDGTHNIEYNHIDRKVLPPYYTNTIPYPTWLYKTSAYDAFLCHQQILQDFTNNSNQTDRLLLLEDDSFIENDFTDILDKANPPDDFDMLYLGCYNYDGSSQPTENKNLRKLYGSGGWHGVILTRPVVIKLLQFNPIGPYDWICGQLHKQYKCFGIYPCIVSQKDGWSFVEDSHLSKPDRYKL